MAVEKARAFARKHQSAAHEGCTAAAKQKSMAKQVTSSSGKRRRLRRVQVRAVAGLMDAGSARSKATAFGTKSMKDQRRITA